MKLRHIAAVATLALLLPLAASALSIDDIQQQIANLLAQITQLQEQLKQLKSNPPPVACTMEAKQCPDGSFVGRSGPNCEFAKCPALPSRICPQTLRQLSQGATGDDVTKLQQYLGVNQTGYFGPMTAKAVAEFQANEGLSQVGIVGPATRAAFARRCGKILPPNSNFSASPTSGPAPLHVTFRWLLADGQYILDPGDGQRDEYFAPVPDGVSTPIINHTYTANGTYIATLYKMIPPNGLELNIAKLTVGTVTITVGGTTSAGAPSISGLDAPTSLSVGQSGTWTVHASAPAGTQLHYSVTWGDEGKYAMPMAASMASTVNVSGSFTHTYQSAGTYTPTFTVSNDSGSAKTSATVSVVVGSLPPVPCPAYIPPPPCPVGQYYITTALGTQDSRGCWSPPTQQCVPDTSATFSASPTSGTAPLKVSFSASSSLAPGQLSLDYGDGSPGFSTVYMAEWVGSPPSTFSLKSHTYTSPGTYTAKLRRIIGAAEVYGGGDTNLYEILGTATITVGESGVACTTQYAPVCGQTPDSCFYTDPPPSYCSGLGWRSQQTYSNRCSLDAAHAVFVHDGAC